MSASTSTETVTDQRRWSSVVLGKIRSLWSLRGLLGSKTETFCFIYTFFFFFVCCVSLTVCALKLIRKHFINIMSP